MLNIDLKLCLFIRLPRVPVFSINTFNFAHFSWIWIEDIKVSCLLLTVFSQTLEQLTHLSL